MTEGQEQRRLWAAECDDTHYELRIERGRIAVTYHSPPEYHYMLSDNCCLADFVAGKYNESVRAVFGAAVLRQALDVAVAELAKEPP